MRVATFEWSPAEGLADGFARRGHEFDGSDTLVLAFGGSDPEAVAPGLDALAAALPGAHVVACSTAGHFVGERIDGASLVGAVCGFHSTSLAVVHASLADRVCSYELGTDLAGQIAAAGTGRPPLAGVLMLCEGIAVNGSALIRGVRDVLGDVEVFGGLAGDGTAFERTWVYHDGTFEHDGVVAVGLFGDVQFTHASQGGWRPFGLARRVTASAGNVLYELDGRPALELYREYLGKLGQGLPATALLVPLAVSEPGSPQQLVRTILSIDEHEQSMRFAGDIPLGSSAQLMQASADDLVDGAARAAETCGPADAAIGVDDGLTLAISCVGRRLVLGERSEEELEAVRETIGADVPLVGFYSYGEISSAGDIGELHNQTMTITRIVEPSAG